MDPRNPYRNKYRTKKEAEVNAAVSAGFEGQTKPYRDKEAKAAGKAWDHIENLREQHDENYVAGRERSARDILNKLQKAVDPKAKSRYKSGGVVKGCGMTKKGTRKARMY